MASSKPSLEMLENYKGSEGDLMSRVKSLSAVIISIQYILEYKVKNEYILENSKQKPKTTKIESVKKTSSSNKGCLVSFVLTLSILLTGILVLII